MFSLFIPFPPKPKDLALSRQRRSWRQWPKGWCRGGVAPGNIPSVPRASEALTAFSQHGPGVTAPAQRTGRVDISRGQPTRERNPLQQGIQLESASLGLLRSLPSSDEWPSKKYFFGPRKGDSWSRSLSLHEVPRWASSYGLFSLGSFNPVQGETE